MSVIQRMRDICDRPLSVGVSLVLVILVAIVAIQSIALMHDVVSDDIDAIVLET